MEKSSLKTDTITMEKEYTVYLFLTLIVSRKQKIKESTFS